MNRTMEKEIISFNDIIKSIDRCDSLENLSAPCKYLDNNKRKYPLIQLEYAVEFIAEKTKELLKGDKNHSY